MGTSSQRGDQQRVPSFSNQLGRSASRVAWRHGRRGVRTEDRLASQRYECWEALYAQATAAGCGEIVARDEERVAATDELLAAALPALVRVAAGLMAVAIMGTDVRRGRVLRRESAAALRLLDRALIAHGRDHGYDPDAWRMRAATTAWVLGDCGAEISAEQLATTVEEVVRDVAHVFVALRRDRLGVAECLADAIGRMLVTYGASGRDPL